MDFWQWLQGLFAPKGSEANPIPLPAVRVVAPPGHPQVPFEAHLPNDMPKALGWYGGAERARELLQGSFVRDTLMPLIALPEYKRPLTMYGFSPNQAMAHYTGPAGHDTISITPDATMAKHNPRQLVEHEFGHAFDRRMIDPIMTDSVKKYYNNYFAHAPMDWREADGKRDSLLFDQLLDAYATSSEHEFFAETFRKATEMLSRPVDRGWHTDFTNLSHTSPQVIVAMQGLVQQPVFGQHPARQMILGARVQGPELR